MSKKRIIYEGKAKILYEGPEPGTLIQYFKDDATAFNARNVAAGTLSKRLGIEEGQVLPRPMVEFYLKDDALGDPLVTEEHIAAFGWAAAQEYDDLIAMSLRVNDFMSGLFAAVGIRLVDFKLEFGRYFEGDSEMPRILKESGESDNVVSFTNGK